VKKDGIPRVYDAHAETPTYRFIRGADSSPDTEHPLTPGIPAFFGNADLKMTPEPLPLDVYYPDSRPFVHRDLIAAAKGDIEKSESAALKSERHANVLKAEENLLRAQQQLAAAKPESETYDKEAVKKLGEARAQLEAAAKALESQDAYTPVGKIYPDSSTGRRLALARWIANKQNPLTARVAINHMWLRHFGQALVPTV